MSHVTKWKSRICMKHFVGHINDIICLISELLRLSSGDILQPIILSRVGGTRDEMTGSSSNHWIYWHMVTHTLLITLKLQRYR
jgi:hypothetical protein